MMSISDQLTNLLPLPPSWSAVQLSLIFPVKQCSETLPSCGYFQRKHGHQTPKKHPQEEIGDVFTNPISGMRKLMNSKSDSSKEWHSFKIEFAF
jgi:hypothetical protein